MRRRDSARDPSGKALRDTIGLYLSRVGHNDPRRQLAWALARVERPKKDSTPGDRDNLRHEIAAFAMFASKAKGAWALTASEGVVDIPTEEEAWAILEEFDRMLARAIAREPIPLGQVTTRERVAWFPRQARYVLLDEPIGDLDWHHFAVRALGRAIAEGGHLLKECPAPASRGEEGETCGAQFVAKRPNQEYCSATCQSRASTRAARAGTETPATVKHREKMNAAGAAGERGGQAMKVQRRAAYARKAKAALGAKVKTQQRTRKGGQ